MKLDLIRHGPKNNDPAAHGTGVEALLDPRHFPLIYAHAQKLLATARNEEYQQLEILTTPVDRAVATGKIEYDTMIREVVEGAVQVAIPHINALIGSYAIHPETGEAVNLGSKAMSKVWGDAKKSESYAHLQGENKPLYAWFEQGLDNLQGWRPGKRDTWNGKDPGITLRESAWRIGTFLYESLERKDNKTSVIAFGHSGDIEPWVALTLQMHSKKDDGKSGTTIEQMRGLFTSLGGALEPLSGYSVIQKNFDLYLVYVDSSGIHQNVVGDGIRIGKDILQEQARLYRAEGLSNKVLAARLELYR